MQLREKTGIVTGAGSGIGRAIALAFAREGARLVLSDIDSEGGERVAREIRESNPEAEVVFQRADAASPEDHATLVGVAKDRFGGLQLAVNNAGIGGELNPVGDLSVDGWRKVVEINLSGVFYAMHAQIPAMLESGGGAIVNIASILGQVGTPGAAGYVAAKHGVVGLTQTAALDYATRGVRINAIGPAYIDTPLLSALPDDARAALVSLHPMGRLGRAEEVAALAVWLASEGASFVTGSYYPVDGGYLAQ